MRKSLSRIAVSQSMSKCFQINVPNVVSETIGGEVVIVHLDKGYYYSLMESGADVWNGIKTHGELSGIVNHLTQIYEGSEANITVAVVDFLDELLKEELIITVSDYIQAPSSIEEKPGFSNKPIFEKPMLEKFTDMEDLLLLDPIHEVDVEVGWPSAKTAR